MVCPPEPLKEGEFQRFSTNNKTGDKAGWYLLKNEGGILFGFAGDWRTGKKVHWSSKEIKAMNSAEHKRLVIQRKKIEAELEVTMKKKSGNRFARRKEGVGLCEGC